MRKLRLEIEKLEVESFAADEKRGGAGDGTVKGYLSNAGGDCSAICSDGTCAPLNTCDGIYCPYNPGPVYGTCFCAPPV